MLNRFSKKSLDMNNNKDIMHRSKAMAELEFKEAPMEHYYTHPIAGMFSRLRIKHILRLLNDIKGKTILDVGCEAGYISKKLLKAGYNVVAFDICFEALLCFKKKIKENNPTKTILFQGLAQEIPLKEGSVDAVVCTEVIEHAPYPEEVMKEISRVVRNNGKIIFTFPNERARKKVYSIVRFFGINTEIEHDVTLFEYEFKAIESLCRKYFKVIRKYSIPFFFPITRFIICIKE